METVEVTDLYQASYYLLSGCEITGVECIRAGKGTSCRLTVQGANLATLASDWFERQAVVNLWTFRNAYTEINSHVQQAKRSFELSLRYRRDEA
jgi:hypothetical protein